MQQKHKIYITNLQEYSHNTIHLSRIKYQNISKVLGLASPYRTVRSRVPLSSNLQKPNLVTNVGSILQILLATEEMREDISNPFP